MKIACTRNSEDMVDYDFFLAELKRILKEKGLKFTRQRELIFKTLYENDGHFSPEELNMVIQRENPDVKIGIATIYRTLSLLEEAGLAESLSLDKQSKRYEMGLKKHHDHLICTECGKIIEFYDETIEKQQEIVAKSFGFRMKGHSMKITGVCRECILAKESKKRLNPQAQEKN